MKKIYLLLALFASPAFADWQVDFPPPPAPSAYYTDNQDALDALQALAVSQGWPPERGYCSGAAINVAGGINYHFNLTWNIPQARYACESDQSHSGQYVTYISSGAVAFRTSCPEGWTSSGSTCIAPPPVTTCSVPAGSTYGTNVYFNAGGSAQFNGGDGCQYEVTDIGICFADGACTGTLVSTGLGYPEGSAYNDPVSPMYGAEAEVLTQPTENIDFTSNNQFLADTPEVGDTTEIQTDTETASTDYPASMNCTNDNGSLACSGFSTNEHCSFIAGAYTCGQKKTADSTFISTVTTTVTKASGDVIETVKKLLGSTTGGVTTNTSSSNVTNNYGSDGSTAGTSCVGDACPAPEKTEAEKQPTINAKLYEIANDYGLDYAAVDDEITQLQIDIDGVIDQFSALMDSTFTVALAGSGSLPCLGPIEFSNPVSGALVSESLCLDPYADFFALLGAALVLGMMVLSMLIIFR